LGLGLKYRLLDKNNPVEVILKGITGFVYDSTTGKYDYGIDAGIEAKERVNSRFAITYQIEDFYHHYSVTEDYTDIRISLGGMFSFTEKLAVGLTGGYGKLWGYDSPGVRLLTATVNYNLSSRFDLLFKGQWRNYSNDNDSDDNSESFTQNDYGISFNWRF
jgi:hypothetical protein